VERWGFCPNCGSLVRVKFESGLIDREIPKEFWEAPGAVCSQCEAPMPRCVLCKKAQILEDTTPWFNAKLLCPLGVVLAGNFACPLYEEWW